MKAEQVTLNESLAHEFSLRLPLNGPFIGAVKRDSAENLKVMITFRIDDRFADALNEATNLSKVWALARYSTKENQPLRNVKKLKIYNPYGLNKRKDDPMFQVAYGELCIDSTAELEDLTIECFSIHKMVVGNTASHLYVTEDIDESELENPSLAKNLNDKLDRLIKKREKTLENYKKLDTPLRETVSRLTLYCEKIDSRFARLSSKSIKQLACKGKQADSTTFAIGSCRYPGFRIEHRRMDAWLENLVKMDEYKNIGFALLLGDQIYADATAGFADPLGPNERFIQRHRYAFARGHAKANSDWFGDWLTRQPVFMTPDDHEFSDGFPDKPIVNPKLGTQKDAQEHFKKIALAALVSYQQLQLEPYKEKLSDGAWSFIAGPARFLILDTRSHRQPCNNANRNKHTILTEKQQSVFIDWLNRDEATSHLNVLVTGSVILPALTEHDSPSNPGRKDNFQANPIDRSFILDALDKKAQQKNGFCFLLVSGDYHLSSASVIEADNRAIGACIVAPPLYAPMSFVNTPAHALWLKEPLSKNWSLSSFTSAKNESSWNGSGMGVLSIHRSNDDGKSYVIEYSAKLWCPERDDTHSGKQLITVRATI